MANKKKHICDEERFCIEKMVNAEATFSEIAKTLGRGLSTISEEVNSNGGRSEYTAQKSKQRAYLKQYRKKKNCNKVALNSHTLKFTEKKLKQGWSPEAISARLETQNGLTYASAKSIRKFIKKRHGLERYLFWNRNKKKSGAKKGKGLFLKDPDRKFIKNRPVSALCSYGHWEMDFIVSKESSFVLLVCVERYSKLLRLAILPNRNNDLVNQALVNILNGYAVHSITTDNDIAFNKWKDTERLLNTQVYFCHPYHSWEKGLVENTNRWIREFIQKKTDLQSVNELYVKWIESYFNNRARVCLEGYTAYEVMMREEYDKLVESLEVGFPKLRIRG